MSSRLLTSGSCITPNSHPADERSAATKFNSKAPAGCKGPQISHFFSIFELVNKLLAILVLGMYSLGLSGLSVSYHFCGDTFMYAELVSHDHADEKGCRESCCGKKSDRCCKDKQVKLVIKEHKQTITKFVLQPFSFDHTVLPAPVAAAQVFHTQSDAAGDFRLRPPPLRTGGRPLYMLHSVFRI